MQSANSLRDEKKNFINNNNTGNYYFPTGVKVFFNTAILQCSATDIDCLNILNVSGCI